MKTSALVGGALLAVLATACGSNSDVSDAPSAWEGPAAPTQPPPTGTKWEGSTATDGCGRSGVVWALVDEICGGISEPGYLQSLRVPMFRDGAQIGSKLYAVDATHLWEIDTQDLSKVVRSSLLAGIGEPLAVRPQGNRLVIASAGDGVVLVDVANPAEPRRVGSTPLPGPAFDVHIEGDRAYVALGKAGVGEVDLSQTPPVLLRTFPLAGAPEAYAVGITVQNGIGYVAACSGLVTLDLSSGETLGYAWLPNAYDGNVLVAPAKDVELVGNRAFVAAGRFGAVAVDVSTPSSPLVQGNCTIQEDLSFYASGLRAQDGKLYVAGGEWGVLGVDVGDPAAACAAAVLPALPKSQSVDESDCSPKPPWEVLPWEDLWAPPPKRKDPIQVLPVDGRVYAFGDARRVGLRAVDIRDPFKLELIGRYEEPRTVVGVTAYKGRVATWGPAGGLYQRDDKELLVPVSDSTLPLSTATSAAFLEDGRLMIASDKGVLAEGWKVPLSLPAGTWSQGLAAAGTRAILPARTGVVVIDAEATSQQTLVAQTTSELPAAVAAAGTEIYLAAPEWVASRKYGLGGWTELADHGVFDSEEISNLQYWYQGLPRRLLVDTSKGLVEVATLGRLAGLTVHYMHSDQLRSTDIPPGTYVGIAAAEEQVYLVSSDRGLYQSQLLTINLASGLPQLVSTESFTGVALGVAVEGDRVYVADADSGLRVYQRGPKSNTLLGVVRKEVTP